MAKGKLLAPLMAGLILAALSPAAMAQIAAASKSAPYKAPRTADGKPDLQGAWSNATLTDLERPAQYGARLVMTPEEVNAIEGRNADLVALGDKPTDPNASIDDLPADCSDGRGKNCNYNAAWTDPGSTVMRVNGEPRTSFITSTPDGRLPPTVTSAGRGARAVVPAAGAGRSTARRGGAFDNPETRTLGERCVMSFGYSAGPIMLPLLYNNTYQIVQSKDSVAILVEMVHDTRIIRLNAKHRNDGVRTWMGDSIGWYEGDTLVVETINFHPGQSYRGSDENMKVTERFTRKGPGRILYQFRAEDPTVWTAPWSGEYEFQPAGGPVYEYACHEGNYALEGILSGARADEEAAAKRASAETNGAQAGR